jgi:glyoxylase I family protein
MPKIKHIALSTQDVEKTARFYIEVFGMKEIARIDDPGTRGCFLSDGEINLAILNFKNDAAAGVERGKDWSGIHHIGFQVESLDAIADRLRAAGSARRDDVNQALGVGGRQAHGNVEVKYGGPDGVMLDVSETGWIGTPSFGRSAS